MLPKKSIDKYDKEFVGLMLEIDKRVEDYPKSQKMKINSWVRTLCFPTNNISWKKNRNLYTILLLDNIINNKLENPFNKFCNENEELPVLNPTIVKSKISSKFLKEISFEISDDEIKNYINDNLKTDINQEENKNYNYYNNYIIFPSYQKSQYKPYNLNKSFEYKSYRPKTPVPNQFNLNNKNFKSQLKTKYKNYSQYQIPFMTQRPNNNQYKGFQKKSDILLNKNYFQFNEKVKNDREFYISNRLRKNYYNDSYRLLLTIHQLNQQSKTKSRIIDSQQKEINLLRLKINNLEKKIHNLFK